jgi:hypothetical protein
MTQRWGEGDDELIGAWRRETLDAEKLTTETLRHGEEQKSLAVIQRRNI